METGLAQTSNVKQNQNIDYNEVLKEINNRTYQDQLVEH